MATSRQLDGDTIGARRKHRDHRAASGKLAADAEQAMRNDCLIALCRDVLAKY